MHEMKQKRYGVRHKSSDEEEESSEVGRNIEHVTCESATMGKMTMNEIIKLKEEKYEKYIIGTRKGRQANKRLFSFDHMGRRSGTRHRQT